MKYIIGVRNNSGGSVGHFIKGYGKVTLWNQGDITIFRDREGNVVPIDERKIIKGLMDVKLTPIYDEVSKEEPQSTSKSTTVEAKHLHSATSVELVEDTRELSTPLSAVFSSIQGTVPPDDPSNVVDDQYAKLQEALASSTDTWKCQFDKESNKWVLSKDGFQSNTPAGIKAHVRMLYGKEAIENIDWIK